MKILIIRPAALGDTLMLLPSLVQMAGTAEIIVVARAPGLAYLQPYVHQSMDYERTGWHYLYMDAPSLIRNTVYDNLRKPPDSKRGNPVEWKSVLGQVSDLSIPAVDLVVAFLTDRDRKITKNLMCLTPEASVHVFPGFPANEERVHVAFYLAKCLQLSGCPLNPQKAFAEALERPLLGEHASPEYKRRIVFHPGSGGITKNHPTEFWMSLVQGFKYRVSSGKNPFVVLLGPAEETLLPFYRERLAGSRIPEDRGEIMFSPDKEALTGLLRSARLYIGHDSGITHLAAMFGTPTIALFKNSRADQWGPLGPRVKVIEGREGSLALIDEVYKVARELVP